jgi:ABC-type lipoprotein release transport system permease subunit
LARLVADIPGVAAHTFRARGFGLVSSRNRSYGAMVEGIDAAAESGVSTLADIIRQGEYLSTQPGADGLANALIGTILARNLKVGIGDEVTILGQGRDGSVAATVVRIQGIYNSGMVEFDRSTIQIPMAEFQTVFNMDSAVHEMVIMAEGLQGVTPIKKVLQASLATMATQPPLTVLDWEALIPGLKQGIQIDLVSGIIFYIILVLVVAFSILNTFLMAILERTHEFGIMMAIGTKPGRLTRLVLAESLSLTLVGVVGGIIVGCLVTWYFSGQGIDLGSSAEMFQQFGIPSRLYPRLTWLSVFSGPLAVLIITLIAALYPALKIRRLRPVEALRHQ